jgi:hypothetical protein
LHGVLFAGVQMRLDELADPDATVGLGRRFLRTTEAFLPR